MGLVDDVVMDLVGAVGIRLMAEALLHHIRVPVGIDADDFASLTVDEHPILGPQGHTLVDVRVSLHIMDELPDHPLIGGTGSIDARSRQRAGHHLALILDVQQVLAQLQNLLGAGDSGVAEVELAGEGASLDEVVLGRVQVKNPEAELVDHLHGAAGQPAII